MNSALALLDQEAEEEYGPSPGPQQEQILRGEIASACDRLGAAKLVASVHEWYERPEKIDADLERASKAFRQAFAVLQRSWETWQSNILKPELAALAAEWKNTRSKTSSSILKWVLHPAYQRIIGKGLAAIPFILQQLEREPDHWFWALSAITGEDPVKEEDRGDIAAMSRAWLDWGKQGGYI